MKSKIILVFNLVLSATVALSQGLKSGLDLNEECPAFDPHHVSGPDAGTRACPMCKYGKDQGVMIWVNEPNLDGYRRIIQRLETEIEGRGVRKLRAFVICMNPGGKSIDEAKREMTAAARALHLRWVAVVVIPGPDDSGTAKLFRINSSRDVKNTVLVYKKRRIFEKFINMSDDNPEVLIRSLEKTLL